MYLTSFFFFNDTATTEIYTLSLHDALPISGARGDRFHVLVAGLPEMDVHVHQPGGDHRSEEHTSELQSQSNLVCRLLLEKKKNKNYDSQNISIVSKHYLHTMIILFEYLYIL